MNIASSPQHTRTSLISFLSAVVDVYARDKNLDICRSFARLGIGPRNHKVVPQVGSAKLVYDSTIGFMVDIRYTANMYSNQTWQRKVDHKWTFYWEIHRKHGRWCNLYPIEHMGNTPYTKHILATLIWIKWDLGYNNRILSTYVGRWSLDWQLACLCSILVFRK